MSSIWRIMGCFWEEEEGVFFRPLLIKGGRRKDKRKLFSLQFCNFLPLSLPRLQCVQEAFSFSWLSLSLFLTPWHVFLQSWLSLTEMQNKLQRVCCQTLIQFPNRSYVKYLHKNERSDKYFAIPRQLDILDTLCSAFVLLALIFCHYT